MSPTDVKAFVAEALQVDVAALADDLRIGGIDAWDSLAHMRLLTAIEERLGKPLDAETAAGIESLSDIQRALA